MTPSKIILLLLITFSLIGLSTSNARDHKGLILTEEGIQKIQEDLGNVPLFDSTLLRLQKEVDAEIELGIKTPIPKDFSGGYTHQRHKANFFKNLK